MSRADRLLLAGLALVLALMVLLVAGSPGPPAPAADSGSAPAGEPRDLDVDLVRRRLVSGDLSDREALFYRR